MQPNDLQSQIDAMEEQLHQYEKLLDLSLKNDVEFAKTKAIFHELKKVTDKLNEIKKQSAESLLINPGHPVRSL